MSEGIARRVGAALAGAVRGLRRLWRGSLHVRVVTITVLTGAIVSFALGAYLYQRVGEGLVEARIASARQDALAKRADAQLIFANAAHTDLTSLRQLVQDTVVHIASPGDDASRRVVMMQALDNTGQAIPRTSSQGATSELVPVKLRGALRDDPSHQQLTIAPVPTGTGGRVPAVVIGSRVNVPNAGAYDLFFLFPMDTEVHTLSIVRSAFMAGGVALVLLLAALAYLLTRMVVTPVRDAAQVAQRLTAGDADERMRVRGEDDLARLARSFNAMADSLQRQIRQLEDLSQLQQRFASDVSHELRTPLTTIRMAVDLIHDRRGDFDPLTARSAELLSRELDRFEALLTDLLEISRFDAGAASLQVEPVDVRDIVTRVVDAAAPLAAAAGVPVRVFARKPVLAPVDQRRIERIVRNLVTNAIEHAEGQPVDITAGAGKDAIAITVRDYGIGLQPGQEQMVFDRFWRADPARARTTGGTGLGLSISSEDAQLHGGRLEAWGAPGEGACFRLTLPVRPGVPIRRSPLPLEPEDSRTDLLPASGPATGPTPASASGSTAVAAPGPTASGAGSRTGSAVPLAVELPERGQR